MYRYKHAHAKWTPPCSEEHLIPRPSVVFSKVCTKGLEVSLMRNTAFPQWLIHKVYLKLASTKPVATTIATTVYYNFDFELASTKITL